MAVPIFAGLDLAAIMAVLVAMALVVLAIGLSRALAGALDVSILGRHPFGGIANALHNSIIAWLNDALDKLGTVAHDLWYALTWSISKLVSAFEAYIHGWENLFTTLWNHSLPALIHTILHPLIVTVDAIDKRLTTAERNIVHEVTVLDTKIENTAVATLATAERVAHGELKTFEKGINDTVKGIESSVDQAVRRAIEAAGLVAKPALDALSAAEEAAIAALRGAENATERELHDLIGSFNPADLATVVAAVPVLAALVHTIAAETGLDNAECRRKVLRICSTSPSAWEALLAGAAIFAGVLSFRELVAIGRAAMRELSPALNELVGT